jgi:hypothetical protein
MPIARRGGSGHAEVLWSRRQEVDAAPASRDRPARFSESLDLTSRQRLFGHAFFPSAFGAGAMVENRPRSFE